MWMSHPDVTGVVTVLDSAFYGGWDTLGWVVAAAPDYPWPPDAGWPVSEGEVVALVGAAVPPEVAAQLPAAVATGLAGKLDVSVADSTYAPLWPQSFVAKPLGNGLAGVVNVVNDDTTGYLYHLRTGPNSGASVATIGIGTDAGSGSGILISHKNAGSGITMAQNPGSGFAIYMQDYAQNAGIYIDQYCTNAASLEFSYKTGAGFKDATLTGGSTTLTCPLAGFTTADNGQVVTMLSGAPGTTVNLIPPGTTITYVNSTTATMSNPAIATGGCTIKVAGRVPSTGQVAACAYDTDASLLWAFRRQTASINLATFISSYGTTRVPLSVIGTAASTVNTFEILAATGTAHIFATQATAAAKASLVVGNAVLGNTATDGFLYLPTVAGTPTGVPTVRAGTVPMQIDTTASKLWAYIGGAWKSTVLA